MRQLPTYLGFIVPIAVLCGTSLLILHSIAPQSGTEQLIFMIVGFALFFGLSSIDYQLYLFSPWPWYILSNILLASTFVLGTAARGSIRWIDIAGVSLQSSEIAKPLLLLFMGAYLARYQPVSFKALIRFSALMLLPTLLIYLQPDLGSALLIFCMSAASFIGAGVPFKKLAALTGIAVLLVPLVYTNLKPYQRQRLQSFLNPSADPLGAGYNAVQATIAVGSGKIFGRGLGQGTQSHLRFLPERHTDFIFASTVEELGFIGGFIILACYTWIARTLITTAKYASTEIGSIMALITVGLLMLQVFINIGMNMSLLPITGITLPLVSAGGSSLISFLLMLGICFSVARHPAASKPTLEIR